MKIAIEGCAHGELELIYDTIKHMEVKENIKIDLLICCGDFQASRNLQDLRSMAVPPKYQSMCSFYKYYSGEKIAPVLTIFIGGNHEASYHLQELPYGGWAAPNIYYLGYANVVNIGGIRVAGLSGIYKGHDYMKGHHEKPPYFEDTKRSVYHVRNLDVFRLKQLTQPIDIFLSHDWPRGIHQYGDEWNLLKRKPFFREDISSNALGSKPCEELLHHLKPSYWFSAHLHVKFAAIVSHDSDSEKKKITKFLALDKCLPKRQFLQVIDVPHDTEKAIELEYDLEWLTVLFLTNHLLSVKKSMNYMPGPGSNERWIFSPTEEELNLIRQKLKNNFEIPKNFVMTVKPFTNMEDSRKSSESSIQLNPQTVLFCEQLGVDDPLALLLSSESDSSNISSSSPLPSSLTPDRSQNISFVTLSDSFESGDLDDSSDINSGSHFLSSTPVGKESTSGVSFLRKSLVLPSPQNCDSDDLSKQGCNDRDIQDSDTDNVSSSCEDGSVSNPEHRDICFPIGEVDDSSQPKVKKFRRRNQALYASADED